MSESRIYAIAAAVVGLVIIAALISIGTGGWDLPDDRNRMGGWVFEYQGLIAAFLALVGALPTVLFIQHQIAVSSHQLTGRPNSPKERSIDRSSSSSIDSKKASGKLPPCGSKVSCRL
jgi:hypothetical protein